MTPIPSRLLRPQAEACHSRPALTERDRRRRDYIIEAARNIFIQHGPACVTLPQFGYATGLTSVTIRRHVSDLHHLFGLVLAKHLDTIIQAIGHVPRDPPGLFARRRAAYFGVTRGFCNVPTPLHFLLVRDRFSLPADELESIETQRSIIGAMIGGANAEDTLALLDSPTLDLEKIEAMHAALAEIDRARHAAAQREAPPTQAPPTRVSRAELEPPAQTLQSIRPPATRPFSFPRLEPALANLSDDVLLGATVAPAPSPLATPTPSPLVAPTPSPFAAPISSSPAVPAPSPLVAPAPSPLAAPPPQPLATPTSRTSATPRSPPADPRPGLGRDPTAPATRTRLPATTAPRTPPRLAFKHGQVVLLDSVPLQRMCPPEPQVRPHAALGPIFR